MDKRKADRKTGKPADKRKQTEDIIQFPGGKKGWGGKSAIPAELIEDFIGIGLFPEELTREDGFVDAIEEVYLESPEVFMAMVEVMREHPEAAVSLFQNAFSSLDDLYVELGRKPDADEIAERLDEVDEGMDGLLELEDEEDWEDDDDDWEEEDDEDDEDDEDEDEAEDR